MHTANVVALRREYGELILMANGLLEAIRSHAACNVPTFSRMASEARAAAHRIASEIERLIVGEKPAPVKKEKHGVRDTLVCFFSKVVNALAGAIDALVA